MIELPPTMISPGRTNRDELDAGSPLGPQVRHAAAGEAQIGRAIGQQARHGDARVLVGRRRDVLNGGRDHDAAIGLHGDAYLRDLFTRRGECDVGDSGAAESGVDDPSVDEPRQEQLAHPVDLGNPGHDHRTEVVQRDSVHPTTAGTGAIARPSMPKVESSSKSRNRTIATLSSGEVGAAAHTRRLSSAASAPL